MEYLGPKKPMEICRCKNGVMGYRKNPEKSPSTNSEKTVKI
jgi:hypothetical protein